MKSFVLAEKPSVAREIARVLGCTQKQKHHFEGAKYVVSWALGHLVTLAEPEEYDARYQTWHLEHLPMLPDRLKLKVIRETSHQFKAIAQLAKRSDLRDLIIATDAGREGELVARWIMELIHWRKPYKRLWISSQTDQAIRDGFSSLKPGSAYDHLYRSAVCRAEADWLIGLNVTRALTCKYEDSLAAGRVQTPTLSIVIDREQDIRLFQSKDYWLVRLQLGQVTCTWRSKEAPDGRIWDHEEATTFLSRIQQTTKQAIVKDIISKQQTESHPLAYDLTELQRDANRTYGFSAKHTSNVLQTLYEQHKLVTYPRTDSRYLSSDMKATLSGRLQSLTVPAYDALIKPLFRQPLTITKRIIDDSKVTDHHAIIPTETRPQLNILTSDERKIFDLIVKRFISLFYAPFRYNETTVTFDVAGEQFIAKGRTMTDAGWKTIYGSGTSTFNSNTAESSSDQDDLQRQSEQELHPQQTLPIFKKGEQRPITTCKLDRKATQPPRRYTESTLLGIMEKHHLGTPATRADIIEKLLATDTLERKGNILQPTPKGFQLIELVAPALRSPQLTASWELELEKIAKGNAKAEPFMAHIREQTKQMVDAIKQSDATYRSHQLTHHQCPECTKQLKEIKSKRTGKRLVCSNPQCSYSKAVGPILSNKRCPQCHKKMEIHEGKAGKYAQCKSCQVIEMLDDTKRGGKMSRKEASRLASQYSDGVKLSASLGDALLAAMKQNNES